MYIDPDGRSHDLVDGEYVKWENGEVNETRVGPNGGDWIYREEGWKLENEDKNASIDKLKTEVTGGAEFYEGVHKELVEKNITPPDYLLGYGYNNCKRFTEETVEGVSEAGEGWIPSTAIALQEKIKSMVQGKRNINGELFRREAFDSHVSAYIVSDLFYDLTILDLAKIATTPSVDHIIQGIPQIIEMIPEVLKNRNVSNMLINSAPLEYRNY